MYKRLTPPNVGERITFKDIDQAYGDRNLVCSCVGMEAYGES